MGRTLEGGIESVDRFRRWNVMFRFGTRRNSRVDETMKMSVQTPIAEYIRVLRARAERYRRLAEGLVDRQMAAEVLACASELEDEVERLERRQLVLLDLRAAAPRLAPSESR